MSHVEGGFRVMPKHQPLDHLRLQIECSVAKEGGQDFRHWLANQPFDVRETAEIDGKPTTFDKFFIVEGG
jgi:hypothetical protein